jgi:hypothetical protein
MKEERKRKEVENWERRRKQGDREEEGESKSSPPSPEPPFKHYLNEFTLFFFFLTRPKYIGFKFKLNFLFLSSKISIF